MTYYAAGSTPDWRMLSLVSRGQFLDLDGSRVPGPPALGTTDGFRTIVELSI